MSKTSLESICDQKMVQSGEHWFAQQLGSDGLDVHCAGCSFDKASIKDYTYTLYIIFHHINKFNHLCWFSFSKSSSLFLNPRDPARYFPNCVSSGGNLGTVCTSDLSATPLNSATLPLPLVNGRIKWSSVGGRIHFSAVWVD